MEDEPHRWSLTGRHCGCLRLSKVRTGTAVSVWLGLKL